MVDRSCLAGCGKKSEDPQAVPVPSGTAAAVAADSGAAASATAPVTAAPTTPVVVNPEVQQQPIDACCAALAAEARSGKSKDAKAKAAQAATICPGIAKLVKSGATTRASALTQIRSALVGVTVPGECH
ncbi:MAG: hypothetical protein U0359_19065 [Byssovorax sp.]